MLNVLSVILGGGRGARLYPLTKKRSEPAVPIAGKYRLIDIPVSNCINSGIKRICVVTQYLSVSLHRHINHTYEFDPFTDAFVGGAMLAFVLLGALVGAGEPVLAGLALAAVLGIGFALSWLLAGRGSPPVDAVESRGETGSSLLRVVAARFLFLLGIYAVGRFLLLFVADRFGLTPDAAAAEAGMALASLALVTVAASLPAGWLADRIGRRALMVGGGLVGGAGIALLPAADSMVALIGAGSLMAIGSAAFGSASWALLADLSPAPRAGGALGLANLGTAGAAAAAGGFGAIIDVSGFGAAFAPAAA